MNKFINVLLIVLIAAVPLFAAGAPVILDVRTEQEWNSGHVEGAVLIPHDKVAEEIGKAVPDKQTRVYFYCRSGRRTGIAIEAMKKAGYTDLIDLKTIDNAARELKREIVK